MKSYHKLKELTKKNNVRVEVTEKELLELVTDFNDTLYEDIDRYHNLIFDGSNEFSFVDEVRISGQQWLEEKEDLRPVYIQTKDNVIYEVILSKLGCTTKTISTLERKLDLEVGLMRRNKINPERIGAYITAKFEEMIFDYTDCKQFKKRA